MSNNDVEFIIENQKRLELRMMKLEMLLIATNSPKENYRAAMAKVKELQGEIDASMDKSIPVKL